MTSEGRSEISVVLSDPLAPNPPNAKQAARHRDTRPVWYTVRVK